MKPHTNITGQRFGRLTAVMRENLHGKGRWRCRCDCGGEVSVALTSLRRGLTKSCGCLRKEVAAARQLKHGNSTRGDGASPEYRAWQAMKNRCLNERQEGFKNYGGRGITICDRWMNSFENFLADMGTKPTPQHTLERVDNDDGYSPTNCTWATRSEQNRNRRKPGAKA